jgi:hypothetical protein
MPKRIAPSVLNASTEKIINTIRANASAEYQDKVPEVLRATDIPKVGEVLYGTPALANEFVSALVNRIAMVRITSKTYNNPYAHLKKGMLDYGETIEEVFVDLCKANEFTTEKAQQQEFKKTLPDVKSAFHIMNYRVKYPITISPMQLRQAFSSAQGVTDLITKIIESVYNSAEYDEFLLFKYLLIKGVTKGHFLAIPVNTSNLNNSAVAFRGTSNALEFMSTKYNNAGVHTFSKKNNQAIFMDADFSAQYDVNVLASAFNMDKATFDGKLHLIDNWTEFDSERFEYLMEESDGFEQITQAELELMEDVKAVLVDEEYFQVYDNLAVMTSTVVGSSLYTNYWYHVWKTLSWSPFSNAVVFVDSTATTTLPASITYKIKSISKTENATIYALGLVTNPSLVSTAYRLVQTKDATEDLVSITPYGLVTVPDGVSSVDLVAVNGDTVYSGGTLTVATAEINSSITLTK